MTKIIYSITAWKWNGYEYEPSCIYHSEDPNDTKAVFEATHLHLDMTALELYEYEMESDDGLSFHMTESRFLDRRDY